MARCSIVPLEFRIRYTNPDSRVNTSPTAGGPWSMDVRELGDAAACLAEDHEAAARREAADPGDRRVATRVHPIAGQSVAADDRAIEPGLGDVGRHPVRSRYEVER